MSTCNRLNLQTLGSQPIMSKNILDHYYRWVLALDNVQDWSPQRPSNAILALQSIPLSKQPFKTQPQIQNEDVTCSPQ